MVISVYSICLVCLSIYSYINNNLRPGNKIQKEGRGRGEREREREREREIVCERERKRERERRMKEADTLQLLLFAEVAAGPPTTCYASVSGGGGRSPNIYPRQYNNSTISSFWSRAPKSKSLSLCIL